MPSAVSLDVLEPPPSAEEATARRATGQASSWGGPVAVGLVLLLWLLWPTLGAGRVSIGGWGDQTVLVAALQELQSSGRSAISDRGTVGPGYLAVGSLLARATGLDAGAALIVLARLSFLVLLGAVLLGARRRGARFSAPVLAVLAAAVVLTPWRVYSDVPWTHPLAAALLLLAVVALRGGGALPLRAGLLGACTWLLAQTRSFEFQALLAAVVVGGTVVLLVRVVTDRVRLRRELRALLPGAPWFAAGLTMSWLTVGEVTGAWRLFGQYQSSQAEQAGTLALDLGSVPTKLVQLFVDPCYRTFCGAVGDYRPQGLDPGNLEQYWRQPLLLQLPFTAAALTVVLLCAGVLLARRQLPPLDVLVAVAAAGALVLGYTANPIGGGAHLKYGFVRDFTAPAALLLYAAGRSVVHLLDERRAGRLRTPSPPVVAVLLAVAVLALVPGFRLPRVGPVLSDVALAPASSCLRDRTAGCSLDLVGEDLQGDAVDLRDRVVLASSCDGTTGPAYVAAGVLPEPVAEADAACRARGGAAAITYRAVELGVYQTPEGESAAVSRSF